MKQFGAATGLFKKKTRRSLVSMLPAMAVTVLLASFALWSLAATPVIAGLISSIVELCHSLFNRCLDYIAFARMGFFWAGGLVLLSGLIFAAFRAVTTLLRSARAMKRLPVKNKKSKVVLIEDRTISTAFTHGIIRPRIYISRGLMESLDRRELRAVLHHELCHKKNRDPLRFFLLSIVRDTFYFIPLASHIYGLLGDRQEEKADDLAVSSMREPLSIAGALLKLAGAGVARPVETISIFGRRRDVEDRIKRLLGEKTSAKAGRRPRGGAILVSLILPLIMLISLAMPLKDAMPSRISTCATTNCTTQKVRPDKHCHTHCQKTDRLGKSPLLKTISDLR